MNSSGAKEYLVPALFNSPPAAILAIATVYAVVAKVSFLVTIPPGNVSPIFPSAGIALAAVLILGRRALAGVWLGSFAANGISFLTARCRLPMPYCPPCSLRLLSALAP